ncbi:GNAT family N-acetyltransferase [Thiohalorhabdus sp. Cl-TMA]|uniref:L-ornithine N(alpha)-acyltransferase n=1 Tax=Thiohalorhabdus methylotrophus TaxID=3242694 RepID=A0ABV4TU19_9GAMM
MGARQETSPLQAEPVLQRNRLEVVVAESRAEVERCQRLRYEVFTADLGARIATSRPGLDHDSYDAYCRHLYVRDNRTGAMVGTTRLLTSAGAVAAGGFYSAGEFDLRRVLSLPGRFLEVGRTCIHPDYRRGAAITTLWNGIAGMAIAEGSDYLIGCPSIPLGGGRAYALAVMDHLRAHYHVPESLRVVPRHPLPRDPELPAETEAVLPPLMKAYMRLGARVCGEPFWDEDFNVADVFILLETGAITRRYARHFFRESR